MASRDRDPRKIPRVGDLFRVERIVRVDDVTLDRVYISIMMPNGTEHREQSVLLEDWPLASQFMVEARSVKPRWTKK